MSSTPELEHVTAVWQSMKGNSGIYGTWFGVANLSPRINLDDVLKLETDSNKMSGRNYSTEHAAFFLALSLVYYKSIDSMIG
jgi:hypothetical protein